MLLQELIESRLATDLLGVCAKLLQLVPSHRSMVAAEAAITLCALLKVSELDSYVVVSLSAWFRHLD